MDGGWLIERGLVGSNVGVGGDGVCEQRIEGTV